MKQMNSVNQEPTHRNDLYWMDESYPNMYKFLMDPSGKDLYEYFSDNMISWENLHGGIDVSLSVRRSTYLNTFCTLITNHSFPRLGDFPIRLIGQKAFSSVSFRVYKNLSMDIFQRGFKSFYNIQAFAYVFSL